MISRRVRRWEEKRKREREKKRDLIDMKSYTAAGSNIRLVWMIRGCQHSRRAAPLTGFTTSLVWPSSSMPPLLTTKWKTANRYYWGEVPCRRGDKRPPTQTRAQQEILTHFFDFCDSNLKGIYEKAIEAEVDILHIVGHSPSLHTPETWKFRTSSEPVTTNSLHCSNKKNK